MAVPNTSTFTLQDVVNEVNPTTDDLIDCFADAVASKFDAVYSGSKNQLLNFRNYGSTPPTNANYLLSSITSGSSKTLSWTGIPRYAIFLGGFVSQDGKHGIVVASHSNTYYIGYYSYNIAFQSNQIYYSSVYSSIAGTVQTTSIGGADSMGCSISKDQRRIQVLGLNSSGTKICETIYLTSNSPGFGTPSSVSQSTVSTFTGTNFYRTGAYVSQMSNNLFGYVAVNNGYVKQLFIGRNLYSSSTAASANFGGFATSFNKLEDGFMDGTAQPKYNPIATIGDQDEYVLLYSNTANNTDKLYMYEMGSLPLNYLDDTTEQTLSFGSFSSGGSVANMNVPNVDKLILYINKTAPTTFTIEITDKDTNF
jgi:hypothetical protein